MHHLSRAAVATGDVLVEQATVIMDAVDALPPEHQSICEEHLLGQAKQFDASELRVLGRRVLEVVDPDAADAHEAAQLDKQEQEAAKKTSFSMTDQGDGTARGRFTLPTLQAEMLRHALLGHAAPKSKRGKDGAGTYDHTRPSAEKLGEAFREYVSRYPKNKLPTVGGLCAQIIIAIPLQTLRGGLEAAGIVGADAPLSPAMARHLACVNDVIPAVLDTDHQIIEHGDSVRLFQPAQRLIAAHNQQHCQHARCRTPWFLCHAHHKKPWAHGGTTNLDDLKLLCPRHHTLAHRDIPRRT